MVTIPWLRRFLPVLIFATGLQQAFEDQILTTEPEPYELGRLGIGPALSYPDRLQSLGHHLLPFQVFPTLSTLCFVHLAGSALSFAIEVPIIDTWLDSSLIRPYPTVSPVWLKPRSIVTEPELNSQRGGTNGTLRRNSQGGGGACSALPFGQAFVSWRQQFRCMSLLHRYEERISRRRFPCFDSKWISSAFRTSRCTHWPCGWPNRPSHSAYSSLSAGIGG